jgi:chorismate synthase
MRFGSAYRLTLFGSSHGPAVGVVIDGVPAGLPVRTEDVQAMLDRRSPVGRRLATRRQEPDRLVVDQGVVGGRTDGNPIRAHVANVDVRRSDYARIADTPRPGHADYPARLRYGPEADLSGGGIFSGRMTVGLVIAGALASAWLRPEGVRIASFVTAIGPESVDVPEGSPLEELVAAARGNEVGCPDGAAAQRMEAAIAAARRSGDSVGGIIETRTTAMPVGLGEPFFDSVEAEIAHLAFSIPAVKGIEFGSGFRAAGMRGSEHNDAFYWDSGAVRTRTNHAGGILGGLTDGMPLRFRVAVKPTSSIARPQETVDLRTRRSARLVVPGRHDPCIVPRATVVVEAITAIALWELWLRRRGDGSPGRPSTTGGSVRGRGTGTRRPGPRRRGGTPSERPGRAARDPRSRATAR